MLDYDDSAFYYFSLAVLTFILLPYYYYIVKTIIKGNVDLDWEGVNCETAWFRTLLAQKQVKAKSSIWTRSLLGRIGLGAALSYVWYLNFSYVNTIEGL
jgi:cytochrome c biogenesis protein CcdA